MKTKEGYVLILWDRGSNGQITASFKDLNSIDQAVQGVVRGLKQYNETHSGQRSFKEAKDVDIEKVISQIKWTDSNEQ